jgi:DNA primase
VNENIYNVSCRKILDKLNLKYQKTSSGELQLVCPNPLHHDSSDDGGSFFVNDDKLVFHCFGCDWQGSIFTFVKLYLELPTFEDAVDWLKDNDNFHFDEKEFLKTEIGKRVESLVVAESAVETNPFFLPKVIDINKKRVLAFFNKRKITKEIAVRYGAKVCFEGYYQNRVIIPIMHNKQLYGFEARVIDKSLSKDKCLYPPNASLKKIIYDIDYLDRKEPLYFTEGMMDCLSLKSRGYLNSSCSFGSKVAPAQIKLLNKFKTVYLVPDSDKGGQVIVNKFFEKVKMPEVYIVMPPEGKDIDECENEEISEIIKNKKHISDYVVDRDLNMSQTFNSSDAYSTGRLKRS